MEQVLPDSKDWVNKVKVSLQQARLRRLSFSRALA